MSSNLHKLKLGPRLVCVLWRGRSQPPLENRHSIETTKKTHARLSNEIAATRAFTGLAVRFMNSNREIGHPVDFFSDKVVKGSGNKHQLLRRKR